jgi:hypothetical protein
MKSAVLVFPGINREQDMVRALKLVAGSAPALVWHADTALPAGTDLVVLPGGFSYGDYLRCGAIAARAPIMDAVRAHAARGGLVLGVCNGFQILCEAGLLPGVLMRNARLKFLCREVYLKVERAFHPRLQCRPGHSRPDRARGRQLRRRRRNDCAARRRGQDHFPLRRAGRFARSGLQLQRRDQRDCRNCQRRRQRRRCRTRKITWRHPLAAPTGAVCSRVLQTISRRRPKRIDP